MPKNDLFPPEGMLPPEALTLTQLRDAAQQGTVLEGLVRCCDVEHDLRLSLGSIEARIPRQEVSAPWISGAEREISILSRVGKVSCFAVESVSADAKGAPIALLSRRKAQEEAMDWFLQNLEPGDILRCRVTHLAPFGAFLDIGRGIVALLPLESISVSRIPHPEARFQVGQKILAAVSAIDPQHRRITLTHKELLGTWMDNASRFHPGETVQGIVRTVQDYGSFIELTPNLSGLADATEGLHSGDRVSVCIKSIRPERMKIKLQIIQRLPPLDGPEPLCYSVTDGSLDHWVYSPPGCEKSVIETRFKGACP